jgi:hypothetical protein
MCKIIPCMVQMHSMVQMQGSANNAVQLWAQAYMIAKDGIPGHLRQAPHTQSVAQKGSEGKQRRGALGHKCGRQPACDEGQRSQHCRL